MRYQTAEGYKALKELREKRRSIEINPISKDGLRWIENIGTAWRLAGFADELARIDHRGWYTDEDNFGETIRGIVYRLPNRKGENLYAVGYADPYNPDCARVKIDTFEDDVEAAYAADRIAELTAETDREYHSIWRLGTQYYDAGQFSLTISYQTS